MSAGALQRPWRQIWPNSDYAMLPPYRSSQIQKACSETVEGRRRPRPGQINDALESATEAVTAYRRRVTPTPAIRQMFDSTAMATQRRLMELQITITKPDESTDGEDINGHP